MKMKFIMFLVICIFLPLITFSQAMKRYQGNFSKGKAIYDYFENENEERIYNGLFSYEYYDYGSNKIEGFFKNNMPDSNWCYKKENKIISKVIFSDGKRNGCWTYNDISIKNNIKYEIKLITYFKENNFDSLLLFSYKETDLRNKHVDSTNIVGTFKDGYMNGTWKLSSSDNKQYLEKYIDGYIYYYKIKDLLTGSIILQDDSLKVFTCLNNSFINYDERKLCKIDNYTYEMNQSDSKDYNSKIIFNIHDNSGYEFPRKIGDILFFWGIRSGVDNIFIRPNEVLKLEIEQFKGLKKPKFPAVWIN